MRRLLCSGLSVGSALTLAFSLASDARLDPRRPDEKILHARLAELRALAAATPWPATSATAIGARLQHDPAACAAFVRTRLRHEPYAGILRGSDGVLAAGGGNSAELCRLLRDLIAHDGAPRMRFAWGTLGDAAAADLVRRASAAPPAQAAWLPSGPVPAGTQPTAAGGEVFATRVEVTRQELHDVRADLAQLGGHAGSNDVDAREAASAARVHAWLQVEHGDGWRSIDPVAFLPVPEAVSVGAEIDVPAHVVHLRIDVERNSGGALRREPVFEKEWPTATLFGKAIDIVIAPEQLALDATLGDRRAEAITRQASGFTSFGCLVGLTGEALAPGRAFDLEGRRKAAAAQPLAVDPFRRLGRGTPTPEASELTGVFATFTMREPGREPHAVERALLDRVGPAVRRQGKAAVAEAWKDPRRVAIALLQRHRAFVPTGFVGATQLTREALSGIVDRRALEDAVALKRGEYRGALADAFVGLPDLPIELCQVSDTALAWTAASCAGKAVCFLARPNLSLLSEFVELIEGDRLVERTVLDLARHEVAVLGEPAAANAARVFHGLAGSELEGRALRGTTFFSAAILRAAFAEGIDLRLLQGPDEVDALTLDPDVRARMASEVAGGARVLAPVRAVVIDGHSRYAWWRLPPGGTVVAVGLDGRGQGTSEGLFVLKEISVPMVKRCMKFVQCFNAAVAGGGTMREAGGACLAQTIQDIVKDSLDRAIDHFVKDPLGSQVDAARAQMLGEEYEALYQKAKAAWGLYQQAQAALDDPLGQIPGIGEVSDAARAAMGGGAEIGSALGGRLYLLLAMGSDIAAYARKL